MALEGTAAAPSPTDAARRRLFRITGIAGVAAVVLIFVAVLVGAREEPSFNATATEVLSYYQSPHTAGPISGLSSGVGPNRLPDGRPFTAFIADSEG